MPEAVRETIEFKSIVHPPRYYSFVIGWKPGSGHAFLEGLDSSAEEAARIITGGSIPTFEELFARCVEQHLLASTKVEFRSQVKLIRRQMLKYGDPEKTLHPVAAMALLGARLYNPAKFARSPQTDPRLLAWLARHASSPTIVDLAQNPATPPAGLEVIVRRGWGEHVLNHPQLTAALAVQLLDEEEYSRLRSGYLRGILKTRPDLAPDVRRRLLTWAPFRLRYLPMEIDDAELLQALSRNPDEQVREHAQRRLRQRQADVATL